MPLEAVLNKETSEPHPLDARSFACHTAVLAQSGSGKSFLVGRLIEEILIKTRARVVILDVNSDFVRLPEVDESVWTSPGLRQWLYPLDTLEGFRARWDRVQPLVLSNFQTEVEQWGDVVNHIINEALLDR